MKARIIARHRPLIFRDPPDHDRLRLQVMHQFTRERIEAMRGRIHATVDELIDRMEGRAMTISSAIFLSLAGRHDLRTSWRSR